MHQPDPALFLREGVREDRLPIPIQALSVFCERKRGQKLPIPEYPQRRLCTIVRAAEWSFILFQSEQFHR